MTRFAMVMALLVGCSSPSNTPNEPVTDTAQTRSTTTNPVVPDRVPRNLLMISIDTFRKDHWSRYDLKNRNLTPFMDSLMDDGLVADEHRTCSAWTFHGVSCSIAGRYPIDDGFLPKLNMEFREPWPDGTLFLGDWLREAGFYTVLSSSNGLFNQFNFNDTAYQGFQLNPGTNADVSYAAGVEDLKAAMVTGNVERWFLHLHFLEPHASYAPDEAYLDGLDALDPIPYDLTDKGAHYQAAWTDWPFMSDADQANLQAHMQLRYEGEIRWLDDQIKAFFDDLDEMGWLEDTLVVFWTDHGEQFWERGHQSHGFDLNLEENDGVFFLWWPEHLEPLAFSPPTSQIDIAPTVMQMLDVPIPDEVTGSPLGTGDPDRLFWSAVDGRAGMAQSIRRGDDLLIYSWSGTAERYDTRSDPLQTTNLYASTDPTVLDLWTLMGPKIEAAIPLAWEHDPIPPPGLTLP